MDTARNICVQKSINPASLPSYSLMKTPAPTPGGMAMINVVKFGSDKKTPDVKDIRVLAEK